MNSEYGGFSCARFVVYLGVKHSIIAKCLQQFVGEFTFLDFKVLNLTWASPPPSQALKILHQLASDPGIIEIMKDKRWKVGLLSEMPPEGKVGISRMCLLGYNVNKGQEISLRLRTDDLKGFRKYRQGFVLRQIDKLSQVIAT